MKVLSTLFTQGVVVGRAHVSLVTLIKALLLVGETANWCRELLATLNLRCKCVFVYHVEITMRFLFAILLL